MREIQQAGAIIMNSKGQIALVVNSSGSHTLPKGAQEAGESLADTARREIAEETGLTDIIMGEEVGTITRPGYTADNFTTPSVLKVIHIYRCQANSTTPLTPQLDDIKQAYWASLPEAIKQVTYQQEREFLLSIQTAL